MRTETILRIAEAAFLLSMAALMGLFVYVAFSEGVYAWFVWAMLVLATFTTWAGVMVMRG